MELLFFGAILVAFLIYLAVTNWVDIQAHLFLAWIAMAGSSVCAVLYAIFR